MFSPISQSSFRVTEDLSGRSRFPFNDFRLFRCWEHLCSSQLKGQSSTISHLSKDRAEAMSYYRFLSNSRVSLPELIHQSCQVESSSASQLALVHLGDTTTLNLTTLKYQLEDFDRVGYLDTHGSRGLYAHTMLSLSRDSGEVLGLSDLLFYSWDGQTRPNARRKAAWSDKQSYKWALGAQHAQAAYPQAQSHLFVFDREADDSKLMDLLIDRGAGFVIRTQHDRIIQWKGQRLRLSALIEKLPVLGSYEQEIEALNHYSQTNYRRIKRGARRAVFEVRAALVDLPSPTKTSGVDHDTRPLWVVDIIEKELKDSTEKPIHWRLWTTEGITTLEQARQIITYYQWRWHIEQLFRLLKQKGFQLENSGLRSLDAFLRQAIITFRTAAKVLQLTYARNQECTQPTEQVFSPQAIEVLSILEKKYQGKTKSQKNPFPPDKLSWATWIIARMGGWKGYSSAEKPPGPITLKRGWARFEDFFEAFQWFNSS